MNEVGIISQCCQGPKSVAAGARPLNGAFVRPEAANCRKKHPG